MIIGKKIIRLGKTTSTMEDIERIAAHGEPEGVVVVADFQSEGRGRSGRDWTANPGSALLCSILLRPPVPVNVVSTLPLHVGVVVAEAIEAISAITCSLKWPNDVLINDKKVAGILLTSKLLGQNIDHICVGIGINLCGPTGNVRSNATSIEAARGEIVEREHLLNELLHRLDLMYQAFVAANGTLGLEAWTRRAVHLNERVFIAESGDRIEGEFAGVDDSGALVIRLDDGSTNKVVSGEFVRGPRRIA